MFELKTNGTAPKSVADVIADLDRAPGVPGTLPTGFDPLDSALEGGFRTRELVLVGGIPGVGKTVATLQWARNLAVQGQRALYACYEHTEPALFGRLLGLEMGLLNGAGGLAPSRDNRATIRDITRGERRLEHEVAGNLLLRAAYDRLTAYADRLLLLRASGVRTGLDELAAMARDVGPGGALFVDYLQKIPVEAAMSDADHATAVAEGLKEIALDHDVAVVAVVAGDQVGLNQRRFRIHHLRGAAGLAYEADVVVMLNDKYLAVSKRHSAYDPVQADRFKRLVVFSIDKNRDGQAGLDLEFTKDFAHYRFDPLGSFVDEQLIDELLFPE